MSSARQKQKLVPTVKVGVQKQSKVKSATVRALPEKQNSKVRVRSQYPSTKGLRGADQMRPSEKHNDVVTLRGVRGTTLERRQLLDKLGAYIPKLAAGVVRKTISLDTTDNPFEQLLDLITLEHAESRPHDFEVAAHPSASGFKCYLVWALMTAFRKVGNLQFSVAENIFDWPPFPDEASIPNALFFLIQYHMPYDEFGCKGETKLLLDTIPTGSNDSIGGGGTGFCSTTRLTQLLVTPINDPGASFEFENKPTGTMMAISIPTIQQNWEFYSKIVSERGCSRLFSELSEVAPDGSAYGVSRQGNADMISIPFINYREDLCQAFTSNVATSVYGSDSAPMMSCFTIDKSGYRDATGNLTHDAFVKARNEYVWYCARHSYTGNRFRPYYMGRVLSTFVGVIRNIDLTGYHEMCAELLKYYAATNSLSLTAHQVYNFLYVCELALAARLFNGAPLVFTRGSIVSGKARDLQFVVYPEAADIKLPAVIADYISCLGVVVSDDGRPFYFKPSLLNNTKFGWVDLSAVGASDYAIASKHLIKPFIVTTGAISYSPLSGITWDAAFVTANAQCLAYPQKWLPDIVDDFYGLFTSTGMDICVAPESRMTLGGICTQVYVHLTIVPSTIVANGVINFQYRTNRKGMSSTYDLVGSEYARAAVYAFCTVPNVEGTLHGRFVGRMPSEVAHVDMLKFIFTETVQKQGSFAIEMARLRDKTRQARLTKVGNTGELVRQSGSEARPILDRLWASAANYLGQVGSKAGEAIVKVGGRAVDLMSDIGMKLVERELMTIVGSALFM